MLHNKRSPHSPQLEKARVQQRRPNAAKKKKKKKLLEDNIVLEDNIGENWDDLGCGNHILDSTPEAWSMKETIGKLDFIKTENFCSAEDNV